MSVSALLVVLQLSTPSQILLDRALDAVEPSPALRVAFNARIESEEGVRTIAFDPFLPAEEQFRVTAAAGRSDALDSMVDAWRAERQADVRLFADDLRQSLSDIRLTGSGGAPAIQFRHRISPNDGPVDRRISSSMTGRLVFDDGDGRLRRIEYGIMAPVRLEDGSMLTEYQQSYQFDYSDVWRVAFVSGYDVRARGGKWGVRASRSLRVTVTDVRFGLAGDSRQVLVSK